MQRRMQDSTLTEQEILRAMEYAADHKPKNAESYLRTVLYGWETDGVPAAQIHQTSMDNSMAAWNPSPQAPLQPWELELIRQYGGQ